MACVIEDRDMIRMAVFEGQLDVTHINDEDLFEIEESVFEAIADKVTCFNTWETLQ